MRLYTPPERWNEERDPNELETFNAARPFALAPCNLCGIPDCDKEHDGHGEPIVIAISGAAKGGHIAACGVFCNTNSPYNQSIKLHLGRPTVENAEFHAAIIALKQFKAFLIAEATEEAVLQTREIVIKTDSNYLVASKAVRTRGHYYVKLGRRFNDLLLELGQLQQGEVSVRFWKVHRENNLMARELADEVQGPAAGRKRGWNPAVDEETDQRYA